MSDTAKRTPLYDEHVQAGAKMVPFAGWMMPVEYVGLRAEHHRVRQAVGLFDVSHMGEIRIQGPKALETVQWLTTNDASKLKKGQAQYSLLPNDTGGLVDDLIVYCVEPGVNYLICVNASNKDKDFKWMKAHNLGAEIIDESDRWAQIAIQGPKARELTKRVIGELAAKLPPFEFAPIKYAGEEVLVAGTGYTGEDGFEVFVPAGLAVMLWRDLISQGADLGVQAIGLGARDTLRMEMKYSLYGNEIDDATNPYEAGLGWVIKPDAKDFVGRAAIMAVKEKGLKRKLVGFKMIEKGIARHGYRLMNSDGQEIGQVTSGTLSPTLNEYVGIGYVSLNNAALGSKIWVEIRDRRVAAEVVPTPFVKVKGV